MESFVHLITSFGILAILLVVFAIVLGELGEDGQVPAGHLHGAPLVDRVGDERDGAHEDDGGRDDDGDGGADGGAG